MGWRKKDTASPKTTAVLAAAGSEDSDRFAELGEKRLVG
jgi:hypothetical protein